MTEPAVCAPTTRFSPSHSTGKERDAESGNDDFGARYYSSAMGRWLSPDWSAKVEPVPYAKMGDPQSLNLYAYVGNDPISLFDPDGHDGCDGWSCEGLVDKNSEAQNEIAQNAAVAEQKAKAPAQQQNNTTGYGTQDAAAKAGLNAINPTSIKQNKEYAGLIYKDADSNYHYTTPNKGKGTSSSVGTAPDGTTVVGDYHTHGDYSRPILFGLFVVRTSAAKDAYISNHFSDTDMAENRDSARSNPQFRGYLGTPSGALRIYNPITDTEGPLQ